MPSFLGISLPRFLSYDEPVNEQWSREILEQLAVEDEQWVVRAAATQTMEGLSAIDLNTPHPIPPLHELPWLIAFAGDRGIGIAPGKPAENLLVAALAEGSSEQQIAALDYLKLHPIDEAFPLVNEILEQGSDDLQEAAFNTLWYNAAAGIDFQTTPSSSLL